MADYIFTLRKLVGHIPLVLCTAGIIVFDNQKRVLLQRRSDNNHWCIPGGCVEPGEIVEEAARREVFEETGLVVDEMKFFGIYSGEEQHYTYPNGDEVYYVTTVFIANCYSGSIVLDEEETKELKFFSVDSLPDNITPTNIPIIRDLKNKKDQF
jgi:8-oxo-dGTP pyrophosphatase MutT (NUDIX family)